MSQILVSMSLHLVITVVNSSNTATDVSGHSKQAQQSQVNVIPSYKLKHGPSRLGLLQSPPSTHSIPDWPAPRLLRRPGTELIAAVPNRRGRVARSGLSGPAV